MKIKILQLINFKQFKDLTIDLTNHQDKKIIALVGSNGTGKSTITDGIINIKNRFSKSIKSIEKIDEKK